MEESSKPSDCETNNNSADVIPSLSGSSNSPQGGSEYTCMIAVQVNTQEAQDEDECAIQQPQYHYILIQNYTQHKDKEARLYIIYPVGIIVTMAGDGTFSTITAVGIYKKTGQG